MKRLSILAQHDSRGGPICRRSTGIRQSTLRSLQLRCARTDNARPRKQVELRLGKAAQWTTLQALARSRVQLENDIGLAPLLLVHICKGVLALAHKHLAATRPSSGGARVGSCAECRWRLPCSRVAASREAASREAASACHSVWTRVEEPIKPLYVAVRFFF